MRPMIGITVNYSFDGSSAFAEGIGAREQEWQLLADDYIASVVRAGGIPVLLPLMRGQEGQEAIRLLLDRVDGVLLSGGNDVDPILFGQRSTGKTGEIVPERDAQEFAMLRYLLEETRKPILGICRGIQVINAALGGTLLQHIPDAGFPSHSLGMYPRQTPSHGVKVADGSLLRRLVGTDTLPVNSFHHMAVDQIAPVLRATAHSEDGVIEAVELRDNPEGRFFLGVQWHPEMMAWADTVQQRILSGFVESCQSASAAENSGSKSI